MLKSKKNIHAGKNATTSNYGQFLPIKNGTFWVKISLKKVQSKSPKSSKKNEVRRNFCVHNHV
jgi:hypothetical protein